MEIIKSIHNLLFPVRNLCYFCNEHYNNIEDYICYNCKEQLEVLDRQIDLESSSIDRAYYSLLYNRYMKELIQKFKFNGRSYLYKPFGRIMVNTIINQGISNVDLILYIPSHKKKEAIRGYNQSELLSRYIRNALDIPVSNNNLVKIKHTRDQSSLDKYQRQSNLRNVFKVKNRREIYNKRILLIDDIITTGSTMIESASILKENKAKEVIGLALTSSKKL